MAITYHAERIGSWPGLPRNDIRPCGAALNESRALVTEGNGEVAPGDEVLTSIDESTNPSVPNNVGLEGEELLQLALDSAEATAANGAWTANADLTLKTPIDVAPGSYSSTLTLSLFEEAY